MAEWCHRSNPEWLEARRGFITASQIIDLWPETPSGKGKRMWESDYIAAILKSEEVSPGDSLSYGAMARGHILEPYAIEEFKLETGTEVHHWDDCLIHDGGVIAFSPDGLSIPQETDQVKVEYSSLPIIKEVTEIKCYEARKHLLTEKNSLQHAERIQIATQMYICKEAEVGRLVLYNPRLDRYCLLYKEFSREDLRHELFLVSKIAARLKITKQRMEEERVRIRRGVSEQEIIEAQRTVLNV